MHISRRQRSLRCIMNGRVISLGELAGCPWGSRCGYAVRPRSITSAERRIIRTLRRYLPKWSALSDIHTYRITSPADGVVTAIDKESLTLRTGDGIPVTVAVGSGLELLPTLGQQLRCNDTICTADADKLTNNEHSGEVAVFFPEPDKITELHIFSGYRRATHRTAFYRTQHP